MSVTVLPWLRRVRKLLSTQQPQPEQQAQRIVAMQLHIVLPAKAGVIAVVLYYLFLSGWFYDTPTTQLVVHETMKGYFVVYVLCNIVAAVVLSLWRRFPASLFQWLAFTLGILDGIFVAGLTAITDGFESIAYWVFPGLIVLNAISIPLAAPQIVLNLLLAGFYVGGGILHQSVGDELVVAYVPKRPSAAAESQVHDPAAFRTGTGIDMENEEEQRQRSGRRGISHSWFDTESDGADRPAPTEPRLLKISVLLLLTACCYGVQVLAERQRRATEEEREFALREAQLRSAGRLAAEFTHQIKNPLAIINNAVFSIQRALKQGRNDISRQIEIIQEEVERSDRIVTQILGYAQLTEGRVEKLSVVEELDAAISQVFPEGVQMGIEVERNYGGSFPPLLMQRRHLSEVLVNILQNAREALNGTGKVTVTATGHSDYSVQITISDTGPGIPSDKLERIFEAYYTSKEKGTGLGLAIVKHNVELYAGTVSVESELGKGARFKVTFPAKTVISLVGRKANEDFGKKT
jgi:signal transduction histidine kinase